MKNALINSVSSIAQNTHISVGLTGWPAAATVIGLGAVAGITIVSIVYIKTSHQPKDPTYGLFEI